LDEAKSDKSELDSLKKFTMKSLNSNNADINLEGFDNLQDFTKRLTTIEKNLQNCVSKNDRKVIDKDIKNLNILIEQINKNKLPKLDVVLDNHAEEIMKINNLLSDIE